MALDASGFNLLGATIPTMETTEIPTKILCLNQVPFAFQSVTVSPIVSLCFFFNTFIFHTIVKVVTVDELRNDNEYEEILEDMREECGKFGKLIQYCTSLLVAHGI